MHLLSCFVVITTQGVCVDPYELLATSLNSYSVNGCRFSFRNVVDVVGCSNKLSKIKRTFIVFKEISKIESNGSFTLNETDSGTDPDSDSKPDGYIVLCRTCSHCTDSDMDPYSLFLYRTGIPVWVCIRICHWQCKWAITWINVVNLYAKELSLLLDKRIGFHVSELKLIDRLLICVSSAHRLPDSPNASRIFWRQCWGFHSIRSCKDKNAIAEYK